MRSISKLANPSLFWVFIAYAGVRAQISEVVIVPMAVLNSRSRDRSRLGQACSQQVDNA